jgi:ATP-dependent 26S proteasome regulatory subunit
MRVLSRPGVPAAVFVRACGTVSLAWGVVIAALTGYGAIASLEGIGLQWARTRTMSLGFPAAAGAVIAALTAFGIASGGVIGVLGWIAVLTEFVLARAVIVAKPGAPSPELAAMALTSGAIVAAILLGGIAVRLFQRNEHGAHLRGRREAAQAGTALLLLSGLWVAAVRTGVLHRFHLTGNVDLVVFAPVVLACAGVAALTWHGSWRAAWPDMPTEEVTIERRQGPIAASRSATRAPQATRVAPARLADVILPDPTRAEIRALIRLIADPASGAALGVEPPAGAILYGPPGTGKTLVARAIAGETGRAVLSYSGSELTSMWVGEGTQLVRQMIDAARAAAPCVLFIDELDGIASARGRMQRDQGSAATHDLRARLGEFLQQLEGTGGALASVFVVGATNRLDDVDPAVRSRLAYHVEIPLPDEAARAAILRQHFPPRATTSPEEVARLAGGLAGRELRELCRVAGMVALAERADAVTSDHFARALERVRTDPGAYATRPAEPSRVEQAAFADLVLPEETVAELRTLVRLISDPASGEGLGVEPPAGAILYGPPGCGKTLIARAIAGESRRPVLAFSGASLTSPFAGEGTQLVRDMFRQARSQAPCVLFVDEIDGIAPARHDGILALGHAGNDATQRIDQFLQELEGVGGAARNVFVVGATNHLNAIDPAVRSRLSYHVRIPLPDEAARVAILRQHFPRQAETTPEEVAGMTDGLSGRDLREMCRIAGLVALSDRATTVTLDHFTRARDRLSAGTGGG